MIGKLANFVEIQLGSGTNRVDAALAEVAAGDLGLSTPADGYGTPHTETATATLYQPVQKYGRTTSLTEGVVLAVNATVNVGYPGGTARFTNQIVVMGQRAGFLLAGDSGSLLVTKNGNRPVGLLFAGSLGGRFGVANRIDDVLSELNVTIDGGTGTQATTTAGQ